MRVRLAVRRFSCALTGLLAAVPTVEADNSAAVSGAMQQPLLVAAASNEDLSLRRIASVGGSSTDRVKFGGFFAGTLAYTYSDPQHWSRAVMRSQLSAEGRLGNRVKWKVGGRVDVDPIYYGSDFYLPDVKQDQRLNFFWSENYLDFEAAGWDFRVGAQNIVWGEVVGLFVADVVSARDLREFLLPSFDVIRIPQWAARAEYFRGDSHLELVWIPVPVFDNVGKPGSDFYPVPLPSPTPQNVASLFSDPRKPDRKLSNGNFGVRANTLIGGWDLAAFYYRSSSVQPTFYRVASSTLPQSATFEPRYDRIWQVGATATKDFDRFVLRGEMVYTSGLGYSTTNVGDSNGVVSRNTLDAIASIGFEPLTDLRVNLQVFNRAFMGGGESDIVIKSGGPGASVLLARKFGDLEPQLLWIQTFRDAGGLIRPRLTWSAAKNTTVGLGLDIFTGPDNGLFGRYGNRDRVYAEIRYDY